jgi:hypothetical protein
MGRTAMSSLCAGILALLCFGLLNYPGRLDCLASLDWTNRQELGKVMVHTKVGTERRGDRTTTKSRRNWLKGIAKKRA